MAEFIKLLISFKKFYKDLLDIGQDIQTFIFSFEKIVSQLNKVKPKSNKSTLYDILGVNVNATTDEIKKAYRKKSMTMHPDKGGDEEKFKQLAGAYEILSNEEKREKYNKENNI
jgi:preprotein translocase subunit Sec63